MPSVLAATVGNLLAGIIGVTATSFLAKFTGLVLLNTVASKLFGPKAPKPAGFSGLQVLTRSAIEYRKIVYGQAIVSGPIYYNNTSGPNNEFLWYGIALVEDASEDLVSVLFDNDVIPKADIDWAAGTGASDGTGTGDVSTSKWVGANSTNAVQIYYYLGDDAQPVSGDLNTAFDDIGTNDRLRGVTHIICQLRYDEDTETVWKSGPPNNIRAVIKGRKIYDPRLDSTNGGSGTHRYTDSTTWAWSENPSLCVADYLVNIMGVDASTSIDWTSVADTATDCEVSVAIPTASTEDRFTCNGALSMGSSHKDNLDSILSSMDGKLSYSGGVWKVRASVWESSSVTITENDLAGDIEVRGSAPKSERFSTIRGFFIDPARNYESAEFPHISDSTYLTRDNSEVISFDLQLPMTNTATMAQRIAFRNLEQGNNQTIAKLKMNIRGAKITVGDVVSLTVSSLSWSAKTFRCIEWRRDNNGAFDITLKEDVSASYTDPIEGDYGTGNTGGVTLPSDVVPAPSNLLATGVLAGNKLTWDNPPASEFDYVDIYEDTNNSWAGATRIARIRADTYTVPHSDEVTYFYWVRAVRLPDLESIRDPDSDTTTISAANLPGGGDGSDALAVNYTNNAHSVPVTNAAVEDWTGSGGEFYVFEGTTRLTLFTNTQGTGYASLSPGEYRLDITKISGDTLTEPGITGATTTTATIADWASDLTGPTVYRITAYILTSNSVEVSIASDVTLTPSDQGFDGADAFTVSYTNNSHSVPVTNLDVETWTGSGGKFYAYEGGTVLTLGSNSQGTGIAGLSAGEYRLNITKISGDTLTEPAITGAATTEATIADWASNLTTATVYRITAYIKAADSSAVTLSTDVTLSPSDEGADGADGLNTATVNLYHKNTSPSTPPSAFSGTFTYTFSTAALSGGTLNGWSQNAPDIVAGEYLWIRQAAAVASTGTDSVPAGEFAGAVVVGVGGIDGDPGAAGLNNAIVFLYHKNTSPSTPPSAFSGTFTYTFSTAALSGGTLNGWSQNAPDIAAGEYLWLRQATASSNTSTDSVPTAEFSTAVVIALGGATGDTGTDGDDGVLHYLTNEAHVIPSNFDGTGYDSAYPGAGGTHKVFQGTTDETTNATHSVVTATKNGLTIAVVAGTGVYSLSGASWTTDLEVFTLRAVFNSVNYDKEYTIAKAKAGTDGGCALTTLTSVSLLESKSSGTSTVGLRVDNDGDKYERANNAASYISDETYIGACANSLYECRLNKTSGTTPTGAAINTWLVCSTDRQWELSTTGALKTFAGTLQIRRTSDNTILATVDVNFTVEANVA